VLFVSGIIVNTPFIRPPDVSREGLKF